MDKAKQWIALAVLAALVVLTGGWFLLVAPTRAEAVALREQAALQESTNVQLGTALEVLEGKAERLPEKEAALAEAARRIPDGPALPELLRALAGAAASAGVELTSVAPSTPSPVAAAEPAPAAPAPADGAAAAPPAPAAPSADAASDLSAIELAMTVEGDFYAVEHFLVLLEELPRALRVTAVSLDPGSAALSGDASAAAGDRKVTTTITGQVYLTGSSAAPAAGAPAAGAPAAGAPAAGGPAPAAGAAPASAPADSLN